MLCWFIIPWKSYCSIDLNLGFKWLCSWLRTRIYHYEEISTAAWINIKFVQERYTEFACSFMCKLKACHILPSLASVLIRHGVDGAIFFSSSITVKAIVCNAQETEAFSRCYWVLSHEPTLCGTLKILCL